MYFEATFQPSNASAYKPDAADFIGKKIAIQDGWVLEEGPHKGQQGYYLPNSTIGLIPAADLKDIKAVPYVQWKDILNRTARRKS
jgi:hypothetical protein